MKKIVALVLTLVLALSLATVAFAATTPTTIYAANAYFTKGTAAGDAIATATNALTLTAEKAIKYNSDDSLKTPGNVAYYAIGTDEYVAVAATGDADLLVYTAIDATEPVLKLAAVAADAQYIGVGTAIAAASFGEDCGKYDDTTYDSSKTYYTCNTDKTVYEKATVATGAKNLLVGGKLVPVTATAITKVTHTAKPVVDITTGKVTSVVCADCGVAAVKYGNAAAVAEAKATAAYTDVDGVWAWVSASTTATSTVSSAKTFDAGVALYAGMALMSVAGSAVVIGKKKEF